MRTFHQLQKRGELSTALTCPLQELRCDLLSVIVLEDIENLIFCDCQLFVIGCGIVVFSLATRMEQVSLVTTPVMAVLTLTTAR